MKRLTSIYELNQKAHETGSHSELWETAFLEADFRSENHVTEESTLSVQPHYVRIKQLFDGSFIMLYNELKNSDGVRMLRSEDGYSWGEYSTVFAPTETKRYANPEAIVLKNGDILCCAAWRIVPDYLTDNSKGGIEIKRSSDNGRTWSEEQLVFTGLTWEPYFLQLRSGELQLYWTNTTRYNLPNGNNTSTGTAMLRSFDNGYTWTGDPHVPYSGQVVAKQATECYDGVQFYTDQMPVAIELQNGTIALSLESRLDRKGNCYISMAYSDDNWAESIPLDGEGPADKLTNMNRGGGPYLAQFPSGETVLHHAFCKIYRMRIGDPTAKKFTTEAIKHKGMTNFSSFEPLKNGHSVLCSGSYPYRDAEDKEYFDVCTIRMHLDHAVFLDRAEYTAEGGVDWEKVDQALFLGSESQAQMSLRFAETEKGLGIRFDRLDYDITSADTCGLRISLSEDKSDYIELTVGPHGIAENGAISVKNGVQSEISAACHVTLFGTVDNGEDKDEGYIAELMLPKEYLPESYSVYPMLHNEDSADLARDTGMMPISDNIKWIPVISE